MKIHSNEIMDDWRRFYRHCFSFWFFFLFNLNLPCGLVWLGKLDGETLEPWTRPEETRHDYHYCTSVKMFQNILTIYNSTAWYTRVHRQSQRTSNWFATILVISGIISAIIVVNRCIMIRFDCFDLMWSGWITTRIGCIVRSSRNGWPLI